MNSQEVKGCKVVKVCNIRRIFWRRSNIVRWLHFILQCLSLPLLSLPVNYSGLCTQTWVPCPPPSLLLYLRTRAVTLITKWGLGLSTPGFRRHMAVPYLLTFLLYCMYILICVWEPFSGQQNQITFIVLRLHTVINVVMSRMLSFYKYKT